MLHLNSYHESFSPFKNYYPNINSGKEKLVIRNEGANEIVLKQTTALEFQQLILADKYLKEYPIYLKENCMTILPVQVLNWDEKKRELKSKFVKGYNLEVLLANIFSLHRKFLITLITELFSQIKQTGFLWGDCSPRNIIIDESIKTVHLCDFERPLYLKNSSVEEGEYDFYIGNYSFEEFVSFTFPEEQNTIFTTRSSMNNSLELIDKSKISSRRKLCLLEILFGKATSYSIQQIRQSEGIIADAVTPFFINKGVFFPMKYLDKLMQSKPKVFFAELVLELNNLTENAKHEKILSLYKSS